MPTLTAFVLAALAGYAGLWYFGSFEGNFALLMFMATLVTGIYWLAERFYFLPKRLAAAQALELEADKRRADLQKLGIAQTDINVNEAKERLIMQPWWLGLHQARHWCAGRRDCLPEQATHRQRPACV